MYFINKSLQKKKQKGEISQEVKKNELKTSFGTSQMLSRGKERMRRILFKAFMCLM